ncbi:TetR/AcrR family transcriptional regulator [Streptomyces sp. LX-29]|uniref:TetR/AcrR family transcriptional regulator n=1 Tax=Streptomyces sp. LX-29 TaxID=2900152 RepID=UPI00240D67D9|nr:TetR/AcrR family transcriptional regulator [Streptomyces sp. LX-29]WFB07043.1 TetR/AcrR family transcriptional regulator [Streptomyces sp. LX-29]
MNTESPTPGSRAGRRQGAATPGSAPAPTDTPAPNAPQPPGTVRPGGRTARTRAAVRDAVLTGLAENGYPGLTVEYVAEHSGVHKTTLYRRWGGVEGLVADALDLAGEDSWIPPDTGSLEGDLRALAREVYDTFSDPATAAAPSAFIAAAFQSERAADALRGFYAERFARCADVVRRAVERGEAPAGTDAGAVVRAVSAPLFFRALITREPLDEALGDQTAAAVHAAVRAGAYTASGTTGGATG